MRIAKLGGMVRGWFVGAFEPTLFHTSEVEVAVQRHAAGTEEAAHFHRIATEITVLVSGLEQLLAPSDRTTDRTDAILQVVFEGLGKERVDRRAEADDHGH